MVEFCVLLNIPGSNVVTKAYVCAQHFDYYPAEVGRWVQGMRRVNTSKPCDCCARGVR